MKSFSIFLSFSHIPPLKKSETLISSSSLAHWVVCTNRNWEETFLILSFSDEEKKIYTCTESRERFINRVLKNQQKILSLPPLSFLPRWPKPRNVLEIWLSTSCFKMSQTSLRYVAHLAAIRHLLVNALRTQSFEWKFVGDWRVFQWKPLALFNIAHFTKN